MPNYDDGGELDSSLATLETADGGRIAVFKDSLSVCSQYFDALFNRPLTTTYRDVYTIPGIEKSCLTSIIRYANTGEAVINDDNVEDLLEASDQFLVEGLLKRCCDHLAANMRIENCFRILELTQVYTLPQVRSQVQRFLLDNFEQVYMECPDFTKISAEVLANLLASDELKIRKEETVWEAVTVWVNANLSERRKQVVEILPHIRFSLMKTSYVKKVVMKSSLIAKDAGRIKNIRRMLRPEGAYLANPFLDIPGHRIPSDIMFIYGGIHCGYKSNTWEVYDHKMNQWSTVHTDFRQDLVFGLQCAAVDYNIYVMGADIAKLAPFCYCFNAVSMTWAPVNAMKQLRAFFSIAVLDKCVYCIGGSPNGVITLDTGERYDTVNEVWTTIDRMNHPRLGASATSCAGKIYIMGGMSTELLLASAEAYDPETNSWTILPSMRTQRLFHGAVTFRNKIYAIGGLSRKSVVCEVYDPTSGKWCKGPKTHTFTDKVVAVVLDDRIFAIGEANQKDYQRCLEYFSAEDMKWHAVPGNAPPRWFYSACVLRNLPNATDYIMRPKRIDIPFPSTRS